MSDEEKFLIDEAISPELASILRSAELDTVPDTNAKQARIIAAATATVAFDRPRGAQGAPWLRAARAIGLASVLVLAASSLSSRWDSRSTTTENAATPMEASRASELASTAVPVDGPPAETSPVQPTSSVSVDDLPSARPDAKRNGAGVKARRGPSAFEDELAVVDAARIALARSDARETLARVAEHRARFRTPRFADEVDALEVVALAAVGERAAALAKAERFAATYPDSPYLQRVRSVVRTPD
jgi:hypothetical protein